MFLAHLKKQGMQIREPVENRQGERITKLQNGTYVMLSKWIEGESLDKSDYIKWRQKYFDNVSSEDFQAAAVDYARNNPL